MSGRENHYHGVDENAETNINHQKVPLLLALIHTTLVLTNLSQYFLAAKAIHGTFDMLADLAPNIPLYQPLKCQLSEVLGAPWQGTDHTVPDFSKPIQQVINKINDVELDEHQEGWNLSRQTVDILSKGGDMQSGNGLNSFRKRWKLWAEGAVALEEEDDEIAMLRRGLHPDEEPEVD